MQIYKLNKSVVLGDLQISLNALRVRYGSSDTIEFYAYDTPLFGRNFSLSELRDEGNNPFATLQDFKDYLSLNVFDQSSTATGISTEAKQDSIIAGQATTNESLGRFNWDQSGSLTVSQRTVLASLVQHNDLLPLYYSRRNGGAGAQVFQDNQTQMSVTTTGDYAIAQTKQYYEYLSGKPIRAEFTATNFGVQAGVEKSIGQYHDQGRIAPYTTSFDGYRLHNDGTTHRLQIFSGGTQILDLPQANWDDPLDGTGASGITIDWDKFNIYVFDFLWLGGSGLRFKINIGGKIFLIHNYKHANTGTDVIFKDPEQPVRYEIRSTGGAGSMQQICASVSLETGINNFGSRRGVNRGASFANANVVGTKYALIGARVTPSEYHTALNIETVNALAVTPDAYLIELIHNPTVAGDALVWQSLPDSAIDYCIPNDTNTVTGGTILFSQYASSGASLAQGLENLLRLGVDLDGVPDQQFICVTPLSANLDVYAGFIIKEV